MSLLLCCHTYDFLNSLVNPKYWKEDIWLEDIKLNQRSSLLKEHLYVSWKLKTDVLVLHCDLKDEE